MGPSKCLKQTIQIKCNRVKNPNCPEPNHYFGYLQAWPRIWTWDYRAQIQLAVRVGLEFRASELQVQYSNHLAMLPPPICKTTKFAMHTLMQLDQLQYSPSIVSVGCKIICKWREIRRRNKYLLDTAGATMCASLRREFWCNYVSGEC